MWRLSPFRRTGGRDVGARTRPKRKREFIVNGLAVLLWIARRLGEGALPAIGGEIGRLIWGFVSGSVAVWLWGWLFG